MTKCGYIKYNMPEAMAKDLLEKRKGDDKKMEPQEYLCKAVNEDFGLLGYCVKVDTY